MARQFAADTNVSVGKSRREIDDLLRKWKCDGIQWTDHFAEGRIILAFLWEHDGTKYGARFTLKLPTADAIRADEKKKRSKWDYRGRLSEDESVKRRMEAQGRREMRVLYLWLKAALNAVEVWIVSAEELFLPFLVGSDGQTFAEVALPRLPTMLQGGASLLLDAGR